jgi:hypothetical protein
VPHDRSNIAFKRDLFAISFGLPDALFNPFPKSLECDLVPNSGSENLDGNARHQPGFLGPLGDYGFNAEDGGFIYRLGCYFRAMPYSGGVFERDRTLQGVPTSERIARYSPFLRPETVLDYALQRELALLDQVDPTLF